MVFDKTWFAQHQRKLLWFANTWIGRRVLGINGSRSNVGNKRIIKIVPNAIFWLENQGKPDEKGLYHFSMEFRVSARFAMRLHKFFRPLWATLHFLDFFLDRFIPKWSFGFATYGPFSSASGAADPCDGFMADSNATWATTHDATAAGSADPTSSPDIPIMVRELTGTYILRRALLNFDTASIPDGITLSSGTFQFYVTAKTGTSNYRLSKATPAGTANIVVGDWDQCGAVAQADDIASGNITTSAYNTMNLNATGLSNINKTGKTSFGFREVDHDINNSAPSVGQNFNFTMHFTESANEPLLTLTSASGGGTLGLLGVG